MYAQVKSLTFGASCTKGAHAQKCSMLTFRFTKYEMNMEMCTANTWHDWQVHTSSTFGPLATLSGYAMKTLLMTMSHSSIIDEQLTPPGVCNYLTGYKRMGGAETIINNNRRVCAIRRHCQWTILQRKFTDTERFWLRMMPDSSAMLGSQGQSL